MTQNHVQSQQPMLKLTNTLKFMHMAASVRETPAIYATNNSTALDLNRN